jgi:hypothetical protein
MHYYNKTDNITHSTKHSTQSTQTIKDTLLNTDAISKYSKYKHPQQIQATKTIAILQPVSYKNESYCIID